jgi:sodium transport system permease protein
MNPMFTVYRKEMREMLRDKRVRSAMFIGPVFSVALMFMLFGLIFSSIGKATKTTVHAIISKHDAATDGFIKALEKGGMKVEELPSVADAEAKIKKGDVRLALDFGGGMEAALGSNKPFKLPAYFDPSEQKAQIALSVIEKSMSAMNEVIVGKLFEEKQIDKAMLKPLSVERKEVKVGDTNTNEFLVQLLPYLIVIWAFYGAMSSASDMVAGEKERQTLETLLISPVARREVALGKLFALATASFLATASSIATIFVFYSLKLDFLKPLFEDGLGLNFTGVLVILVALIPTTMFFASALIAISSFARNTREAQTYLAQGSILVMLPAMFSQIIGFTDFAQSRVVYAIPILNAANVIRNALIGKYDTVGIAMTVGIGTVLALVAMAWSVRLFNRETILNRI